MLQRRTLLALPFLLAAAAARAEGPPGAALAPEMERIRQRQKLVVAVAAFEAPPFVMTGADGALAGYDIDLARGMAAALGVVARFDRHGRTFDELIDIVQRHEADLALSKLTATLDRAVRVRFSHSYLVLRRALLVNRPRFAQIARGREPLALLGELDAAIAVVVGAGLSGYARRDLPRARLRDYARWEPDAVGAVLRGEVLAAYGDEIEARRALAARPEAPLQLRALILPDTQDPLTVALPWDSTQLVA